MKPRWRQPLASLHGPLVVLATAAAAIAIIRLTGGEQSAYTSLLYLPIILAVVRCPFEVAVGSGLALSLAYLYLVHHAEAPGLSREDVVRALTINAMALIGATYARRVEREREQLKHTVEEQEALLNASQIVNSADKLEHALNSALLLLRTLIPRFRAAAIFLADDTQRHLELGAITGAEPVELKFQRFSMVSEASGWNAEAPHPLSIPDTQARPDLFLSGLDPKARSVVCLSLRSLKVPIGMLFVSSDEPAAFNVSQVRLLQAFADRIGFPLQKIRVQEGLQGLAFTDGMTGLYNFRAFRTHMENETKRSVRYSRPLSLIILDLDGFKQINDRYGHPAGDQLLTGIASIVRSTVRETDLPVRYGGEEFAVICPETEASEALVVAERIRAAVQAARFKLVPDETCAITASFGVATYPVHAADESGLLSAADNALYEAKRNGKNQVARASAPASVASDAPAAQ